MAVIALDKLASVALDRDILVDALDAEECPMGTPGIVCEAADSRWLVLAYGDSWWAIEARANPTGGWFLVTGSERPLASIDAAPWHVLDRLGRRGR